MCTAAAAGGWHFWNSNGTFYHIHSSRIQSFFVLIHQSNFTSLQLAVVILDFQELAKFSFTKSLITRSRFSVYPCEYFSACPLVITGGLPFTVTKLSGSTPKSALRG